MIPPKIIWYALLMVVQRIKVVIIAPPYTDLTLIQVVIKEDQT